MLQPAAREARRPEAANDVRLTPHALPYGVRAMVLDLDDDRPLVDAQIVAVDPADPRYDAAVAQRLVGLRQGRVEG